ncbi:MAG TPA: ATP-dependent endonuclease [Sulfurimonas sp.]|uniref:ATP-dependent nuclease n=1 Tax=Sulfurimonas sp. TaxID=2022749 RepID=UPI002C5DCC2D|nr:ATP-dependent endonuclease [Sulfurimonas sp.]HUH43424.1 ATP-dependent endonuclease [Sulfurimonas sp.]
MKITKIKVKNYRLLKDFELDLEESLSLVIGKNNCGKTSLLSILDKFIGSKSLSNNFKFDDFNSEFKDELKTKIESNDTTGYLGISLKLFIEYSDTDDLSNIGNSIMMDLDPDNKTVVLAFEYRLNEFQKLVNDYNDFKTKENEKEVHLRKDFYYFLKINHKEYFKIFRKSVEYNNETKIENDDVFIDLNKEKIQIDKIINFKMIDAKRNVSNTEPAKSLSTLSSKIYQKIESGEEEKESIEKFKDELAKTDTNLDKIYETIFEDVLNDVKKFGGIKDGDSNIKIISTLRHKELLNGNTTVMYNINDTHDLPESYNGLGYMNLISMIFEIKILINEFKRELSEKPADINLLFIEEPEAHTHPQMQYIFIENIKSLLNKGIERTDGQNRKLQTIISTHSAHIVSKSNFNDIKYFKKEDNKVISKNLKELEKEYVTNAEEQNYKFLKQYLTLHRAELFFADKAVFIEGDTERILLPAMMKKIDQEDISEETPLLSQNISIIEVGAYAHIFEKFIDFIGVKSLIITDIDSYYEKIIFEDDGITPKKDKKGNDKKETIKCPASDCNAMYTSNASLKFFYGVDKKISDFITFALNDKKLKKDFDLRYWIVDSNGYLICIYQIQETNGETVSYHARSFEDAFFHINKQFFYDNISNFPLGLKNTRYMNTSHGDYKDDVYYWAEYCVDKKPALAMEILLNSTTDDQGKEFSNWKIPAYIKEGLSWLKEN